MYSIYKSETLETLIYNLHKMHNTMTPNGETGGKLNSWDSWYLNKGGIGHYSINSLFFLRTIRKKYVQMYKEFICQLHMYKNVIKILSKGYLPIPFLPPSKLY